MKKLIFLFSFLVFGDSSFAQCNAPTGLNVSNITMNSVTVNWTTTSNSHHYRIRYKDLGLTNWINFNNIVNTVSNRNLPNLQPGSIYIWQIMSHCDSLGTISSQWSTSDTFTTSTPQCPTPTGLFITNIMHNTALANWSTVVGVDHYRIRTRELGTTSWGNLLNIDSTMISRNLPLLQPLTTYEWKIEAYCDSTNQSNSLWSVIDTFTTIAFVPAPFNPQLFYGMSSTLCNTAVSFSLRVMQSQNEPDIGTSEITSDGGAFNISSLGIGDTVGTAEIATSSDSIMTTLTVGITTSGNYALIYSVDTSGIIGFFTIENISGGGVKVSSTSPPGGNSYTSGYNSLLIFDDLFVTPITPGVLSFTANIVSELNDIFYIVDSSTVIFCNTGTSENESGNKKLLKIVNTLGKDSPHRKNALLFYIYKDGTVEKKLILE